MIYVIKTIGVKKGFFKVGYTKNDSATQRLYKIQTGCPYRLEIIRFFEGSEKDEKDLHEKLKAHKKAGEWFSDNEETRAILNITPEAIYKARFKEGGRPYADHLKELISGAFEHIQGKHNPRPLPLKDFCKEHGLSESEVRENASRCFIVTTSARELAESVRFVNCHPVEFEIVQPFLVPYHMVAKNGSAYNVWQKLSSDVVNRNRLIGLMCLLAVNKQESTVSR